MSAYPPMFCGTTVSLMLASMSEIDSGAVTPL